MLDPQQFVIGFSRGFAAGKSVFVWPSDVAKAWADVARNTSVGSAEAQTTPRGVMFWNINNDGTTVNETSATSNFAKSFNHFLEVRK